MNNNDNNPILNDFNNMFGNNKPQEPVTPYKASNNNLNGDFSSENNNQQIINNSNNLFGVNNIPQNVMPNSISSNNSNVQNIIMPEINNINNNVSNNIVNNNVTDVNSTVLYDTTNSINDVKVEKKVKKNKVKIDKEMKEVIILAVILFIAILTLPLVFDFIDNLKNSIFR